MPRPTEHMDACRWCPHVRPGSVKPNECHCLCHHSFAARQESGGKVTAPSFKGNSSRLRRPKLLEESQDPVRTVND